MDYDEAREQARMALQTIEAKINHLTATVAQDSAQRGTTPRQIDAMDHLLGIFEALHNGYRAVMAAFDQDKPERAEAILEEVEALRAQLGQWLGPP
jgi:hypothetical protein